MEMVKNNGDFHPEKWGGGGREYHSLFCKKKKNAYIHAYKRALYTLTPMHARADPGFSFRGAQKIMFAHAHHEREARRP